MEKERRAKEIYDKVKELNKRRAKEIYDKVKELNNKTFALENKKTKTIKDTYIEEIEIYKFVIEQKLKNIDVILDILKLTTSLSISILIASLSTTYFNVNIIAVVGINIVTICLLILFIKKRKAVLEQSETTLFEVFNESVTITLKDLLSERNRINLEFKKIIKDLQK